ncbi:sulfotransferase [Salinactinospora qingdaonensis]|uniref:Sulfotransferase family protein n=1 Tax=Salinactinospora qingdaonensis TaxID=702744 RepID=A0ABP7FPK0_9ACTN
MKQPPYILVVNGTKVRRPVFVLGAPHSGVELIARALGRSPGFHLTSGRPSVVNAAHAFARRPSIAADHEWGTATLLRDAMAEAWQLTPRTCPHCPRRPVTAREGVEPCRHAGEMERFGDASPDLLYSATALAGAFEDAAFVQIIRDGRDVVAAMLDDEALLSWLRPSVANLEDELPHPFFGIETKAERDDYARMSDVAKCALRWRGAVRLSARLRGALDAERLMTLRYEEVFGAEIDTAEQLSSFTGTRVSAMELMHTGPTGVGAWRNRLAPHQRDEVLNTARTELARLGYIGSKTRA